MTDALISVSGLVKNFQALRPLRVQALELSRGEVVSLSGLDAPAAEMLVGLLTGAVLPDAGEVRLFGKPTHAVADSEAWLAMLDGVGILTDRAVLIAQFSVEQNIAIPFTLTVDPLAEAVRPRIAALAAEVGLSSGDLGRPVAESAPAAVARVRLARALALDPSILLAEHPSALLPRDTVKAFAADLRQVARARQLAVLAITADAGFAAALGGRALALDPASGELRPTSAWKRIFG